MSMLKVIFQTLLGLTLQGSGWYLAFIYLKSLADGPAMWAILCASFMIVSGAVLLLKAGISEVLVVKKIIIPELGHAGNDTEGGFQDKLKKNNKMGQEWDKVNDSRDKLHLLQAAADVENEK